MKKWKFSTFRKKFDKFWDRATGTITNNCYRGESSPKIHFSRITVIDGFIMEDNRYPDIVFLR